MIPSSEDKIADLGVRKAQPALERLTAIALRDTGQSRRAADFLLAWYNAAENGGWDPTDLWNVDDAVADDMLAVLHLVRECHCYPDKLGFEAQMKAIWQRWRAGHLATGEP